MRKPLEGDELAACVAHRLGDLPRPDVLPDENRRRIVRLEAVRDVHQVVLVEETADLDPDLVEGVLDVWVEFGQLHRHRVPVCVLADEGDVDHADRARVDELTDGRGDLAPESVSGKRDYREVDWADLFHLYLLL